MFLLFHPLLSAVLVQSYHWIPVGFPKKDGSAAE